MRIYSLFKGDNLTKGKYDTKELLNNHGVVSLFGYLVRCNKQVHDFQNRVIKEYLERKGVSYSYIHDVIFFRDDAVSFEDALACFRTESVKVKSELLFYLVVVSEIDGVTDFEERDFFDKILHTVTISNSSVIIDEAKKKAERERKCFKKANSVNHTGKRANPNSTDNLFRITQEEYVNAISRCRKTAKEDYKQVKPIVDDIVDEGTNFYLNHNTKMKSQIDFHPEVIESLESFSQAIQTQVFNEAKSFQYEFAKKETTVEDFTIALIGRTKAGKSTLRTVLTGSGKENIGCGAQRTTRINDIYEWNHLRIIDTPGIDAGSDDEDEDQQIAEKVIGESDIICYIAASDGLPKNAREFAVNLAKRNKPVIVLVNYKSNINSNARFRRFISNPSEWLHADSSNTIEGYFYPIKRLAEENGVAELISYKAVFLYAELLSKNEKYAEYSKVLTNNSGVNEFLALLKDAVVNKGTFLRSKTIIDDTIVECRKWVDCIEKLMMPINKMCHSLSDERKRTEAKINKAREKMLTETKAIINDSFNKLATSDASVFAEENYANNSNISKKWESYCENICFYENLQNSIETAFQSFVEEISSIINDLFEDLQFDFPDYFSGFNTNKLSNGSFPFRELFRFLGSGLGVAGSIALLALGSNPIGWILTGAGIVVGFVSNLFKSKAKRQQEQRNRLYSKINRAVKEQGEKYMKNTIKRLDEQSQKCISQALDRYDDLLNGLKFTSEFCNDMTEKMNRNINTLNVLFAERIIEYVSGKRSVVSNVDREYGKYMKIYPIEYFDIFRSDLIKIQGLLNERVIIKNIQEEKNEHNI